MVGSTNILEADWQSCTWWAETRQTKSTCKRTIDADTAVPIHFAYAQKRVQLSLFIHCWHVRMGRKLRLGFRIRTNYADNPPVTTPLELCHPCTYTRSVPLWNHGSTSGRQSGLPVYLDAYQKRQPCLTYPPLPTPPVQPLVSPPMKRPQDGRRRAV